MAQQPPSDRSKAMRIRKRVAAHLHIGHKDAAWFAAYEQRVTDGKDNKGHSKSASKKTTFTQEEHAAEASGTGTAAEVAASAAMVYEEGRRQDHIVDRGITALEGAVNVYKTMCEQLLAERKQDAVVQRALVESVREHYVARAEAEAEVILSNADHAAESGKDPQQELEQQALSAMIEQFMANKNPSDNRGAGTPPNGDSAGGRKRR